MTFGLEGDSSPRDNCVRRRQLRATMPLQASSYPVAPRILRLHPCRYADRTEGVGTEGEAQLAQASAAKWPHARRSVNFRRCADLLSSRAVCRWTMCVHEAPTQRLPLNAGRSLHPFPFLPSLRPLMPSYALLRPLTSSIALQSRPF